MPFSAGTSGNKNGCPKITEEQKDNRSQFTSLLRENTVLALEVIVQIARDERNRDRFKACQFIIDKAYGTNTNFLIDDTNVEPLTIHIVHSKSNKKIEDKDDDWD
jgi:hypothetical protein